MDDPSLRFRVMRRSRLRSTKMLGSISGVRQCISVRFENEIMTLVYCTTNALESVLVDEGIGFCLVAVRDFGDILRARAGTSPFYAAETGVHADYLTGGVGDGGSRLGENRY